MLFREVNVVWVLVRQPYPMHLTIQALVCLFCSYAWLLDCIWETVLLNMMYYCW